MHLEELAIFLKNEDPIEIQQKANGENIADVPLAHHSETVPRMPKQPFFVDGNIHLGKHHRYGKMPEHTHDFVEINYMYAGSCVQFINGKKIVLQAGELLLLDKDVTQQIEPLGEEDLLLNILLADNAVTTKAMGSLITEASAVSRFLWEAAAGKQHDQFLHFPTAANEKIRYVIAAMYHEFLGEAHYRMRSLNLYLSLLLLELANAMEQSLVQTAKLDPKLLKVVNYIESHYQQLTLQETAEYFGYNRNYLSNKLKKEFGLSFHEIVNHKRYLTALEYLQETAYSVETIAEKIGYKNTPSLYRLLRRYTKQSVTELRKT